MDDEYNRKARDRQTYHRKRWSGLTHDEIMNDTIKYHREKLHEHVADLIHLKKYKRRKLFLDIMVWTPLAIWILPFVFRFRKSNEWVRLNAVVVMLELIMLIMLIFKP